MDRDSDPERLLRLYFKAAIEAVQRSSPPLRRARSAPRTTEDIDRVPVSPGMRPGRRFVPASEAAMALLILGLSAIPVFMQEPSPEAQAISSLVSSGRAAELGRSLGGALKEAASAFGEAARAKGGFDAASRYR